MKEEIEQIEQLSKENERVDILNDILKYLIKTRQSILTYDEIEKIVKKREKKK